MIGAERGLPEARPDEAEITAIVDTQEKETRRALKTVRLVGKWALKLGGMGAATTTLVVGSVYGYDVNEVQATYANSHSYLIENSPVPVSQTTSQLPMPESAYAALDPAEKAAIDALDKPESLAIFNNPGFGLVDTYRADTSLDAFDAYGANVSIHYGNEGLNVHETAQQEVDYLHQNNIENDGMYADSMGTIFELKTAVEVLKIDPTIKIPFIIMDSPAIDASVLRPKSRSDAYTLINSIHLPGAEYSRWLRQAAEVYLRKDQISDVGSFLRVNGEAHAEAFENKDMAVNALLEDQAQVIFDPTAEDDFKTLGKLPADRRPVIVFMGSADAARDDVVNTPKSYALIKKWTAEAGLTLLGPYGIKDFYHGAQWRSESEYHAVLSKEVMPDIMAELRRREEESQAENNVLALQQPSLGTNETVGR